MGKKAKLKAVLNCVRLCAEKDKVAVQTIKRKVNNSQLNTLIVHNSANICLIAVNYLT